MKNKINTFTKNGVVRTCARCVCHAPPESGMSGMATSLDGSVRITQLEILEVEFILRKTLVHGMCYTELSLFSCIHLCTRKLPGSLVCETSVE